MLPDNTSHDILRLSLARIQGIKRETIYDYIKASPSLAMAYRNIVETVHRQQSMGKAQKIIIPKTHVIEQELQMIIKHGAKVIGIDMDAYPWMLREIFNPPIALTVKGNHDIIKGKIISIVGTRRSSIVSDRLAYDIAKEMSEMDFAITSGLASGIDTAAHKGAINNTIAIMGTGINLTYPKANIQLAEQIVNSGGVIMSEFPFGTHAAPENFPQRNRIIAGIGYGVLVVEARAKSGSLITARYALEYDREVYATPGFPADIRYAGNNSLIKNNVAKMVESSSDIYEDLRDRLQKDMKVKENITMSERIAGSGAQSKEVEKIKKHIIRILSSTPVGVDDIASAFDVNISIIRIALLELEIEEVLARTPSGEFFVISQQGDPRN